MRVKLTEYWYFLRFIPFIGKAIVGIRDLFPPIEIRYDNGSSHHHFYRLISKNLDGENKSIPCYEYGVRIKNISRKTLKDVNVTIAFNGSQKIFPEFRKSDLTGTTHYNINPKSEVFVPLIWLPAPRKRLPGYLCYKSAWDYGPIKVTVSALDKKACVKIFHFNWESKQVLFDSKSFDPATLSDEWYENNIISEGWYKTKAISDTL